MQGQSRAFLYLSEILLAKIASRFYLNSN